MRDLKLSGDKNDDNQNAPINLLNTIKMPRDIKEINQRLPKKKMYNRELEESNLMHYDVNINRKQNNAQIDLNLKENNNNYNLNVGESKELNSKNKERDNLINNLLRNKEIVARQPPKDNSLGGVLPNQNQNLLNNNNIITPLNNPVNINNQKFNNINNQNPIGNLNNNDPRAQVKKDNYVLIRPISSKGENRPKTPIQQQNIPRAIEILRRNESHSNNHNNIQINAQNKNKPVQIISGPNSSDVQNPNLKNNIMKLEGVNLIQAKIEYGHNNNKPKEYSRPQSSNANPQNLIIKGNNNYNQNQLEINKRPPNPLIPSDRSKSPNIPIRRNIPLSANSPRQKSPIKDKYMSNNSNANANPNINPNVYKINPMAVNNPSLKSADKNVKYINNNKVEIQKINYDYAKLNRNLHNEQKKVQNYHYIRNSNENLKGVINKENPSKVNNKPLVNRANDNLQHYQYLIHRQNSNNPNGPKIVVINQKK
jgi:hypothetical protein